MTSKTKANQPAIADSLLTPYPSQPNPTQPGVRPSLREGAAGAAPALRERFGKDAYEGVKAYCDERRAFLLPTPRSSAGILARHLMLMRRDGWTQELCLDAVRAFAVSKRSPAFFREWVLQTFHAQGDKAHEAQKNVAPMTRAEFEDLLARAKAAA